MKQILVILLLTVATLNIRADNNFKLKDLILDNQEQHKRVDKSYMSKFLSSMPKVNKEIPRWQQARTKITGDQCVRDEGVVANLETHIVKHLQNGLMTSDEK